MTEKERQKIMRKLRARVRKSKFADWTHEQVMAHMQQRIKEGWK